MKIPTYDHNLVFKAELNRDGKNWHNIAVWLCAYKGEFKLAEMVGGWDEERIERLNDIERKLRNLLH
jgi:hypothetical protein